MKYYVNMLCLLFTFHTHSQTFIQGYVKDSKTREALPYCAVGFKNKPGGSLSNEDGVFRITGASASDTLIFIYLGYEKKLVVVSDLLKDSQIYLKIKENTLREVVVYSNDDYLYEAFVKCRSELIKSPILESKVYFVLESNIGEQPVELLECYYNGKYDNSSINELKFKNGRAALADYQNRAFRNDNTSKAIFLMSLTNTSDFFPAIPLQFQKRKLRKMFSLNLIGVNDSLNPVYHIAFTPISNSKNFFSGEVWIDKKSSRLQKIVLKVDQTTKHPFRPLFEGHGKIEHISMQVTKVYDMQSRPEHAELKYNMLYTHYHAAGIPDPNPDTTFEVSCKGLMYFYDTGKPFILPYFYYNAELSDYRKITSLSYNDAFWTNADGLMYSDRMKKKIMYFRKNGQLINYQHRAANQLGHSSGQWSYETNNLTWSADVRVSLRKNKIKNDTVMKNPAYNNSFLADRYQLNVQIFMDINPSGDSIQHYTATIFDVFNTFYDINEEPFTDCFLNIYFDIHEIERRKLEKIISSEKWKIPQYDSLYQVTKRNAEATSSQYIKEVERGKNTRALKKWNDYVKANIGIDNIQLLMPEYPAKKSK